MLGLAEEWLREQADPDALWSGGKVVKEWDTNDNSLGGTTYCVFTDVNGVRVYLYGTISVESH